MTADLILAAMLALPASHLDRGESLEQRTALYRPVAEAIATTARNETEAALLIADGYHESAYARAVLEYRCQDIGRLACDRGKARGTWQVRGEWCKATDVVGEARCALRIIRDGKERCRDAALSPEAGAFSALAGRHCGWMGADKRVATYRRVLAHLRRSR